MKEFVLILMLAALLPGAVFAGMDDLAKLGKPIMKRASTFDRTGGNTDKFMIEPGEVGTLEIDGPGCIKHIWFTMKSPDKDYLRKVNLRMYWDGSPTPAVDCPFAEFFCLGHGEVRDIVSAAICVTKAPHIEAPPGQAAYNCYFPMPFADGAKIEVKNGASEVLTFYAHVDYAAYEYAEEVDGMGRFHARYHRQRTEPAENHETNTTGDENYVILDVQGEGHYVGCNLSVDSSMGEKGKWYEGDEMIFVDGETWPPAIHGTGTEDYFNNAWGFRREFSTPYYGCSYLHKRDIDNYFNGLFTVYRFHILDPIGFTKSIRVTVEHGHANDAGNDYHSVAYWYQR